MPIAPLKIPSVGHFLDNLPWNENVSRKRRPSQAACLGSAVCSISYHGNGHERLIPNSTDKGLDREYEEKADLDLPQEISLKTIGGLKNCSPTQRTTGACPRRISQ